MGLKAQAMVGASQYTDHGKPWPPAEEGSVSSGAGGGTLAHSRAFYVYVYYFFSMTHQEHIYYRAVLPFSLFLEYSIAIVLRKKQRHFYLCN